MFYCHLPEKFSFSISLFLLSFGGAIFFSVTKRNGKRPTIPNQCGPKRYRILWLSKVVPTLKFYPWTETSKGVTADLHLITYYKQHFVLSLKYNRDYYLISTDMHNWTCSLRVADFCQQKWTFWEKAMLVTSIHLVNLHLLLKTSVLSLLECLQLIHQKRNFKYYINKFSISCTC